MEGQVAFYTSSRVAEEKIMGSIDIMIDAGVSVEFRILPTRCTPYELEGYVKNSLSDVFIVGCSNEAALCSYMASYTDRPVIGIPLSEVDDEETLCNLNEAPKGEDFATVPKDDIECGIGLAIRALKNRQNSLS